MATDDLQRLVTGSAPAPAIFTVPGNGQIRPKTIFATFDGSGAGSAFLPTLKVISDGGETVGIYSSDTSVAAGASADVTWFPKLASSTATPPPPGAALAWAYLSAGGTSTSCAGTANTRLTADQTTFYTNSSSLYDVHVNAGIYGIRILSDGHYLFFMSARPTALPAAGDDWKLTVLGGGVFPDFQLGPIGQVFPATGLIDQGISSTGGVMCVGGFISAPTPPIIARLDVASAATMRWEMAGIVVMQLDDVNQDLN